MRQTEDCGANEATNRWTCREERNNVTGLLYAASLAVVAFAGALTDRSSGVILLCLSSVAGSLLVAFQALDRRTVNIDRASGSIRIEVPLLAWTRCEEHRTVDFDRASVWERRIPLDAGWYASQYSVVLVGGRGPLVLLTTDDEREASAVRDDIAAFLRIPC